MLCRIMLKIWNKTLDWNISIKFIWRKGKLSPNTIPMNTTALDECISRMYPDTCGMPVDAKIWTIIFEGALASIASILGTIFNIASLVVLFDPPSRNLFEQLLISLAFCDLTFLSKLAYNIMQDIIISFYSNYLYKKLHLTYNLLQFFICRYVYTKPSYKRISRTSWNQKEWRVLSRCACQ